MSAISPCYAVAGLLVWHKAVIESADKLETSDSGRTRKKPNERQKIMGRARWRISKTQCRGDETGRDCVQKKEETDIGRRISRAMLITFRTAWSKCFAAEEPLMLTFKGFLASSWDEEDSRAYF
jgi:hypothetical protein